MADEKLRPALVQIGEIAPRPALTGSEVAAPAKLAEGIEQAFDYRGDVTITLGSGERLEGYLFDRERKSETIRVMTKPGQKVTIRYADVAQLAIHRPRHGRRAQLGSLDQEIRRTESRRRD